MVISCGMEKPKVRFSSKNPVEVKNNDTNKSKVIVKSIVPVSFPIQISSDRKRILLKDRQNFNIHSDNDKENIIVPHIYISKECESNSNIKLKSSRENLSENSESTKRFDKSDCSDHKIGTCVNEFQKLNMSSSKCTENSNFFLEESVSEIDTFNNYVTNEDSDIEIGKVIDSNKSNPVKNNQENFNTEDMNVLNTYSEYTTHKRKAVDQNVNSNKTTIGILKDSTNSKKKTIKCQRKLQVMPCAKYKMSSLKNKTVEKSPLANKTSVSNTKVTCKNNIKNTDDRIKSGNKMSQVKKNTVFNINGANCGVSVLPGSISNKHSDRLQKLTDNKNIASENLLSQPEYNSTVFVMKKLKEIEEEKVITDIEHLPTTYRNLIYGKVTSALDFAPYESAFKDLINLSVNDEQLPARLLRSRDPEPRSKDGVPVLQHFFKPKYADQYFITVNPTTPSPIDINTLSAFTISKKICTWKMCRDKF